MMRETLRRLHAAAEPSKLNDLNAEDLLAVVKLVFGEDATLDTYRRFLDRWYGLEPLGRTLAEFVVTYGLPHRPLTRDELDALDIAQPYAAALRVRQHADAAIVANGGVGNLDYYLTFTGGDRAAAKRMLSEAHAARALPR